VTNVRVLMLGWEFPPFITGGLGTACDGLTRALHRRGIGVDFVLPRHVDSTQPAHVRLISPDGPGGWTRDGIPPAPTAAASSDARTGMQTGTATASREREAASPGATTPGPVPAAAVSTDAAQFVHGERLSILRASTPESWPSAYATTVPAAGGAAGGGIAAGGAGSAPVGGAASPMLGGVSPLHLHDPDLAAHRALSEAIPEAHHAPGADWSTDFSSVGTATRSDDYSGDLLAAAQRYAKFVVGACRGLDFDVIHAHDWLTYPAGLAIGRVTGRPLVVHVHSTEFDRSGLIVNQRVYDIERRGMHGAIRVITVSMLTRNLCVNRYGIPESHIDVVYNGVELAPESVGMERIESRDKIVLYFGRITMQKGPEFFVQAAKRVLEVHPNVKFVVAGSGDQAQRMIELAASLGIGHKMLFTGFLRGADIARVFAMADLYVMPSVSEPFGIAPLEAMGHDVPVLISRTSGVSEVLTHALKCDFWDVDDMANKIVAVLRHPPLSRTLRHHGQFEVRRLTWDGAAERCEGIYRSAIAAMSGR